MSDTATPAFDIAELQKQLDSMSPEDLREQLLQIKTRQKIATAKYSNPENAKKYRLKKQELVKLMQAKAAELGILDDINTQASANAKARLAAEEDEAAELVAGE